MQKWLMIAILISPIEPSLQGYSMRRHILTHSAAWRCHQSWIELTTYFLSMQVSPMSYQLSYIERLKEFLNLFDQIYYQKKHNFINLHCTRNYLIHFAFYVPKLPVSCICNEQLCITSNPTNV